MRHDEKEHDEENRERWVRKGLNSQSADPMLAGTSGWIHGSSVLFCFGVGWRKICVTVSEGGSAVHSSKGGCRDRSSILVVRAVLFASIRAMLKKRKGYACTTPHDAIYARMRVDAYTWA